MSLEAPELLENHTHSSTSLSFSKDADEPDMPEVWDEGVFEREIINLAILPRFIPLHAKAPILAALPPLNTIQKGTIGGTKLALTQMYRRIERR